MRDLSDDEKSDLHLHCIFCKEPDFILASFPLSLVFDIYCVECRAGYRITHHTLPWQLITEPKQTSQRALDALTEGSSVMDVTTMLRFVSDDIEVALRRLKLNPKDIPAQVQEFERRVSN
ncbi:MAG: hypothetical protein ACT4P9_14790 [Betaproteobacteria bacterium]